MARYVCVLCPPHYNLKLLSLEYYCFRVMTDILFVSTRMLHLLHSFCQNLGLFLPQYQFQFHKVLCLTWDKCHVMYINATYVHNKSLKSFSHDYVQFITPLTLCAIIFIHEWQDLQIKVDTKRQSFELILFVLRVFARNLLRESYRRNFYSYFNFFDVSASEPWHRVY